MPLDINILGEGIYTPRQAARLVGTTTQQVFRWTRGSGPTEPLWRAHYHGLDDTTEISFADLIEVRVVRAFRRAGISLQAIRFAIEHAKEKFGTDHPLSSMQFQTDGKEILMRALDRDDHHVSLSKKRPGQKVFTEIVKQSLNDLEYDQDLAVRWRPRTSVVIDPNRQFGEPILDEFGISTRIISEEFHEFQSLEYLSRVYEISKKAVRQAIDYENFLDERLKKENGQSTI